jgi:hypothetical protein
MLPLSKHKGGARPDGFGVSARLSASKNVQMPQARYTDARLAENRTGTSRSICYPFSNVPILTGADIIDRLIKPKLAAVINL